jgi:hypothetical protein
MQQPAGIRGEGAKQHRYTLCRSLRLIWRGLQHSSQTPVSFCSVSKGLD